MCEEISFCSIPNKFENMKLQVACLIFHFNTCGLFNFRLFISTKPARLSLNPISIFATISKNSNLSIFNRNYIFKFSSRFHLYCNHVTLVFTSEFSPFTNRNVFFVNNTFISCWTLPPTGAPEEVESRRVGGARGRRGRRRGKRGCGASGEASEAVQGEDGEQRETAGWRLMGRLMGEKNELKGG